MFWYARKRRLEFNNYTPAQKAYEMLKRITRDNGISYPEQKELVIKICKRYSSAPERTFDSVAGCNVVAIGLGNYIGEALESAEKIDELEQEIQFLKDN